MAFKSADRFGYVISLPFVAGDPARNYRIKSPSIEVGNFMIESTQLAGERMSLSLNLTNLLEKLAVLPEDASEEEKINLQAEIEDATKLLNDIAQRLTIPDEMESDYFRAILGPAYDAMIENKEPFELLKLAASTVSVWVVSGRDAAEEYWNNGGRPSRPQRAPQDRRTKRGRSADTSK